jgi:3-hydroxybutyryl-CoA dehydrogenase
MGVVGTGVMGAGIAQLGALAGIETVLSDASAGAVAAALERIERDLWRGAARGDWAEEEAAAARGRLHPAATAADLEGCELIVEAVPEDLELKLRVLAGLPPDAVLATNTSSLSVAAIARGTPSPERVVGMHFFNPPPRMRLVELVPGPDTAPDALALARATAVAMGRRPIVARDSIGFVVNRCARPFYAEALGLIEERIADPARVDRACRAGGPFRMGPFELMDLVGLDTSLAVSRSFSSQSFGEPRWKPSATQARLVAAGHLGRKTGRGWHDYRDGARRPPDPPPPPGNGGNGRRLAILGQGPRADALRRRARRHGFEVHGDSAARTLLTVDLRPAHERAADGPALVPVATSSLAAGGRPGDVGFLVLPPEDEAALIELTRLPSSAPSLVEAAEDAAAAMGFATIWADDAPGLVLGRIVCQLVNEACFALGEGVASREDIDAALRDGLNHPRGPLEWGERLGWQFVTDVLDGLWADRHDPRYRVAPLLRRAVAVGALVPPGVT